MFVKILLIIIFIAIAVGVGIYTRRAASRDVDGFILGGRNVGPWLSALLTAPPTSAPSCSSATLASLAGSTAWPQPGGHWQRRDRQPACLVGARSAHARGHAATQGLDHARVLRQALKSKGLRIASAAIIFVFLIPYTASVYNGLSRLFTMAFGAALRVVRSSAWPS